MELFCGIRAFEHAGWGLLASECDGYFLGANHLRVERACTAYCVRSSLSHSQSSIR